jgi:apolipoprotein N-acyltransferase
MARARALETGRPMIRASNSGLSAIISHDGSVDKVAPQFKAVILRGRVQPMSGTTPFVRLGNYPVIFICLFLLAIGILRHRFWGQAKPEC